MKKLSAFLLSVFFLLVLSAQSDGKKRNAVNALTNSSENSSNLSGNSGTGGNIDVIYQRCNWRVNPDTTSAGSPLNYIKGIVDLKFKTIISTVSSISFDLNSTFTINSIRYRGVSLPGASITKASNKVIVDLGVSLVLGAIDSITINYQGTPPIATGAAQGYQLGTTPSGDNFISTLSESYEDRDWWPCKADMQDKIDSMDIIVSTPWNAADTFWVAANGTLYDSAIAGGNRVFKFKVKYPIASYLVSLSVARYIKLYSFVTLPSGFVLKGTFNVFKGKTAAELTTIRNSINIQNQVVVALSQKLGDYPFKDEKYGYYEGIAGAEGMEHQGFYGMKTSSLNAQATLTHELMHQWFGDKVTFQTWADLWLAEGFARYAEALVGELVPATGLSFVTELGDARTAARSITTTAIRLPNISTSNNIWTNNNIRAIYDKGAMVVSMLRTLAGDTKFFEALNIYLNQSSPYSFANTDTLKNVFSRVLGYDLTSFFDAWVYKYGHPTTNVSWNNPSNKLLALTVSSQPKTASSNVSYFPNPVVVRVQGASAGQDTTIVFLDINGAAKAKAGNGIHSEVSSGPLYYQLSFVPTTVTIDPNLLSMATQGTAAKISTVDLNVLEFSGSQKNNQNWITLILDDNSTNKEITLERSIDGIKFETIGVMKLTETANNSSNKTKVYLFKDLAPDLIHYYRANFKNQAGQNVFTKAVKLQTLPIRSEKSLRVQHNSLNEILILANHHRLIGERIIYSIYDTKGSKIMSKDFQLSGSTGFKIDASAIASGFYVLELKSSQGVLQVERFVR